MSVAKNHNSLIFLTTLSVYLGLVLVGCSTAPVLNQAALTRNFDLSEEIEINDDLDKKPGDDTLELENAKIFPLLFKQVLDEVSRQAKAGNVIADFPADFNVTTQFNRDRASGGGGAASNISDQNLSLLLQTILNNNLQPRAINIADRVNDSKNGKVVLAGNQAEIALKFSFGKVKAEQFAAALDKSFQNEADKAQTILVKQLYRNARAVAENDQIFIITNLPRAAIDEFFA